MPCFHPIHAWVGRCPTASGAFPTVFNRDESIGVPRIVKCGQCRGCRLDRARDWTIRLMHEKRFHENTSFITLTYADESLPADAGLLKSDFQKFLKRFRKKHTGRKLRYYHCGEYGEKLLRPHYHAIIFGYDWPDKRLHQRTARGDELYTSEELLNLWQYKGHVTTAQVTPQSCGYVARYVMKKRFGEMAEEHYSKPHPITGEIHDVLPEYTTMSKNIGKEWFTKFYKDVFPNDFVRFNNKNVPVPQYYCRLYEKMFPDEWEKIRLARKVEQRKPENKANNTPERLAIREFITTKRTDKLIRSL